MYSFHNLNYDLNELIYFHLNASKIQTYVRKWFFKHTRHENWRMLRNKLLNNIKINEFKELSKYRLIRREWYQEPQSWIHTVEHDKITLHNILKEVRLGLWN